MDRVDLVADLTALLRKDLRAEQFECFGRGLGDSLEGLPVELVVAGEPRLSSGFVKHSQDRVEIQREGETEFSPYPVREQYGDVLKHGGRLRVRPVASDDTGLEVLFSTEVGRITQVHVLGPALAALGCESEATLLRKFGPTDHMARRHGAKFCWPSRGVEANVGDGGLFSIALGPVDLTRYVHRS